MRRSRRAVYQSIAAPAIFRKRVLISGYQEIGFSCIKHIFQSGKQDLPAVGQYAAGNCQFFIKRLGFPPEFPNPFQPGLSGGKIIGAEAPQGRRVIYTYNGEMLSSVTGPGGETLQYIYDDNRLVGIIKPDGSSREYFYTEQDGKWVLTRNLDEEGCRAESFNYQHLGGKRWLEVPEVSLPGDGERFEYDFINKTAAFINPSGIIETYQFDERLRTIGTGYSGGVFTENIWEDGKLIRHRDKKGNWTEYEYDENNNIIKIIYPEGAEEIITYTDLNKIAARTIPGTDKGAAATIYHYDGNGNLTGIEYPGGIFESFSFYSNGLLAYHTDKSGYISRYEYDACGFVGKIIHEDYGEEKGFTEEFLNDPYGNVLQYTNGEGFSVEYRYNAYNKPVEVTYHADGKIYTETYEYNCRRDLVKYTDRYGAETEYGYDKRHLLKTIINPLGEIIEYLYREDGKISERLLYTVEQEMPGIISLESRTSYQWDAAGFPEREVRHNLESGSVNTVEFEYDAGGNLAAVCGPDGLRREYTHDKTGRVIKRAGPGNGLALYSYWPDGNVRSITDGRGNTTDYRYTLTGSLEEITDPLGNSRCYSYDAAGNLSTGTMELGEGRQRRIEYRYNRMGLVTEMLRTGAGSAGYPEDRTVELFEYDAAGHLLSKTDPNGNTAEYQYDDLGRIILLTDPSGMHTGFFYDENQNITTVTGPLGNSLQYGYDLVGRINKIRDPYGTITSYTYSAAGQIESEVRAAGSPDEERHSSVWNSLGELVSVINPGGAARHFSYNGSGRLVLSVEK